MTSSNVAAATNNKNLRTDIREARDADALLPLLLSFPYTVIRTLFLYFDRKEQRS